MFQLLDLLQNFCWVADFFAISVVPTRNASLWSFEVLHSPPQDFLAHAYVLNSIEVFHFGRYANVFLFIMLNSLLTIYYICSCSFFKVECRLKQDREIFEYSINIFGDSKSDIADEKSSIVYIEGTSSLQVLLSRIPVIFLITKSLVITNLEPQSICLALKSSAIMYFPCCGYQCIHELCLCRSSSISLVSVYLVIGFICFMCLLQQTYRYRRLREMSSEYLPKKAYSGCAVELMGLFVFPGFGH
uniref:Uncharacterized protein n=1 Tax=Vespula pensylvanica TaxID=30213 RepID=A0A834K5F7_VESPE|nr:hypothetical protein H0235_015977 [Vespula pensylvanica]